MQRGILEDYGSHTVILTSETCSREYMSVTRELDVHGNVAFHVLDERRCTVIDI